MSRFFDRRLLRAARPERWSLLLAVLSGALAGIFTALQARSLAAAVNGIFRRGFDLSAVAPLLLLMVAWAAARGLAGWISDLYASRAAERLKNELRERLLRHIAALGPTYGRGERTGELINTALEGVEALDAYFSQYLPQLALAAAIPVAFLCLIFPIDPLTGLVLLLTAPLIPLFMALIGELTDALSARQWASLSRMSAHFLDVLQGLTTLKLFNRSRDQVVLIRRISNQHRDATLEVLRVAFLSALVLEMVGTISTAIVAVEVGLRLLAGRLTFEPAFFVLTLAPEFYLPLRQLGLRFHAGIAGVAAAQRIFAVLETPLPPAAAAQLVATQTHDAPAISFRNVSVAYPDRALPALDGVTFDIAAGEHVALVGPTGAGKSTVAALLLGFIRQQGGELSRRLEPAQAEACATAYVPQSPYLFNASVADNIRLGRPDATDAEVETAARAASCHDFIIALPQGYATVIGERGATLSGGQAQRLALARAFLLDAGLVILDEATANLDPDTEAELQEALDTLLDGRTALIIAHRLRTVRHADKIIVLDGGRVIEQGAHAELLAAGGQYAALARSAEAPSRDLTKSRRLEPAQASACATSAAPPGTSLSPDSADAQTAELPSRDLTKSRRLEPAQAEACATSAAPPVTSLTLDSADAQTAEPSSRGPTRSRRLEPAQAEACATSAAPPGTSLSLDSADAQTAEPPSRGLTKSRRLEPAQAQACATSAAPPVTSLTLDSAGAQTAELPSRDLTKSRRLEPAQAEACATSAAPPGTSLSPDSADAQTAELPSRGPTKSRGLEPAQAEACATSAALLAFLAPFRKWIALSVGLGFLTVASSMGLLGASAWILATAALQPSIAVLQVAIVGVRAFGISRGVFRYLERLASHQVTFRVLAALRTWFYAAIEPGAPASLQRHQSGDLLTRVISDANTLENFYVRAVAPPLIALLVALLTAVILAAYHPSLVLPVLAIHAIVGVGLSSAALSLGRAPGRRLTEARAALSRSLVDLIQGLADLRAFRAVERQLVRVNAAGATLGQAGRQTAALAATWNALGVLLTAAAVALVLAQAAPLVRAGALPGVDVAVLALLVAASFEASLALPLASQHASASLTAARRLFEVAGQPPTAEDVAAALHVTPEQVASTAEPPRDAAPVGIAYRNVTLRYAADQPPALDNLSLDIAPGEMLTVVGPSGAGKSSLANALLRFWGLEGGQVQLGGTDVAALPAEAVRGQIGVVSQTTHLFNASIRTNLLLAKPDATAAELDAALRAAQLADFVAALPQGLDTPLGEGGAKLSGGERQRLAIARGLLKAAPVLILDEPTSGLDATIEEALWEALRPLIQQRTVLLITHRLRAATGRIAVLDRGRLVEAGDHASLLAADGLYRRLWEQQTDQLG